MKKKILFLVHLPPPIHGQSMVNKWIKNSHIVSEKFDCVFLNLSLSDSIKDINKFKFSKIFKVLGQYIHFLSLIATNRFDLVYISLSPFGLQFFRESPFIIISRILKIMVVFHLHAKGVKQYVGDSKFKLFLYNKILKKCYCIHLAKSLVSDLPFQDILKKIFILPNGIPDHGIIELKKEEDTFDVLQISNLIPSKGGLQSLEAIFMVSKLRKDIPIRFYLIGGIFDIDYYNTLNSYVKNNGLSDSVRIFGSQTGVDKQEFYRKSDIFVFPTFYPKECFPLVILESFSYSLPVISTYEGAIPDIIDDGKNGFLINDSHNVDKIAEQIIYLYDNRDIRNSMSNNANSEYHLKYRLDTFEENLCNILSEILCSK